LQPVQPQLEPESKQESLETMSQSKPASLVIGAIAILAQGGCEQLQQAATEAVNDAKQTAVEALEEATQAGSIDGAKQSADNAIDDVRQQAAGLLQQASDYLSGKPPAEDSAEQATDAAAVTETDTES
jgi:hypothetical protein